jgi:hypothetical protein
VPLFRRESLHERLAREGGLLGPEPSDTRPRWGETGIHGIHRPREWDAVATVDVSGLEGDQARFTVLPDGSLLVGEDEDRQLSELADAVDLSPPFRVEAVRRDEETWAVAAKRIEVVEVPDVPEGDELVLSVSQGTRELLVDGQPGFGSVPVLERLGEARYESYVVHAERLDGDLFEVRVSPL